MLLLNQGFVLNKKILCCLFLSLLGCKNPAIKTEASSSKATEEILDHSQSGLSGTWTIANASIFLFQDEYGDSLSIVPGSPFLVEGKIYRESLNAYRGQIEQLNQSNGCRVRYYVLYTVTDDRRSIDVTRTGVSLTPNIPLCTASQSPFRLTKNHTNIEIH